MKLTDKAGKSLVLQDAIGRAVSDQLFDADGGIFFQRQLEKIKANSYDVQYPQLKARMMFPVNNEGGDGINSITYRTYDQTGMAKIISAYADDLPRADIGGKETTIPVRTLGISYGYNIDEIRSAQVTGMPLDQRRSNAAVKGNELTIDNIAWNGDAEHGLPGLFTNPNIPTGNVANPGSGTAWATKSPGQILDDVNEIFADIFEGTNQVEQGNTLGLPTAQWSYIMSTPRSDNSDTTIAAYLASNSPYLNSVEDFIPLNEFAGAGTGGVDIMMAYDRSPDKLELEIPVELEFLPVQQRNLEFVIPGRSRVGGLNIYYPLSLNIKEGI